MKINDPEDTFICAGCFRETKEYYRSEYDESLCVFCDTEDLYEDEYWEYDEDEY